MIWGKRKKRFVAAAGESLEEAGLAKLFEEAKPFGDVRLSPEGILFYKMGGEYRYLELKRYNWVFRRVEGVNAKLCCGKANFDIQKLVFGEDGRELAEVQVENYGYVPPLLQALQGMMPQAKFGYDN